MANDLKQWIVVNSDRLSQATAERAPNFLAERQEIADFLHLLATQINAAPELQLAEVQFWAITNIGYDAPAANDWRTILRLLKDELGNRLEKEFTPADALRCWRQLDDFFTYALIEVTQLSSDIAHAVLLDHMVKLRQQSEQLEESKSNFVVVAAHELKTPLTIVEGYAKMLQAETQTEPQLKVYVDGLHAGSVRMREIITDLIDVSLLDLRTLKLEYQQFYLEKIILMVADSVTPYFTQRQVELVIKPLPVQQRVYGDPERLATAFYKVIMNGLKYTPDGGCVTVNSVLLHNDEYAGGIDYIDVQIIDTGIGIDPEDLEMIFRKFTSTSDVKLHSSSKTKFRGDGPGLGLPIAQGIVEAHGGRIWAESQGYNEKSYPGSTFHIELPILLERPEG